LTQILAEDPESPEKDSSHQGLLRIRNHVVQEEIARGGMGIVYRARQLEPSRPVALKMLPPHHAGSAEMLKRFHLEVQTIAALEHPAILPIYHVGEYEGMHLWDNATREELSCIPLPSQCGLF
jgi:serine/threonine protein kinase